MTPVPMHEHEALWYVVLKLDRDEAGVERQGCCADARGYDAGFDILAGPYIEKPTLDALVTALTTHRNVMNDFLMRPYSPKHADNMSISLERIEKATVIAYNARHAEDRDSAGNLCFSPVAWPLRPIHPMHFEENDVEFPIVSGRRVRRDSGHLLRPVCAVG